MPFIGFILAWCAYFCMFSLVVMRVAWRLRARASSWPSGPRLWRIWAAVGRQVVLDAYCTFI